MLEIINSMVLLMFGILIGVLLMVSEAYESLYKEKSKKLKKRQGESFLHYSRRSSSREYHDERIKIMQSMPKPFQRAGFGMSIFVILLIIVLIFSPIYMNWLIFIISVLVGIVVFKLIFYLAKAGKIKIVGESFFDIPLAGKPSLDTKENQHENINI